ncbi:MAG: hypothetical protein L6Q99_13825 [Planctomycetes bacterium]|nr:hypothetical protein [Planctomycetota bacterium]
MTGEPTTGRRCALPSALARLAARACVLASSVGTCWGGVSLAAASFANSSLAQGVEHVLVEKRKVAEVDYRGTPWAFDKSGRVGGAGKGNDLVTSFELGVGDWTTNVRLSIDALDGKRSSFAFGDDAVLVFDADKKFLRVEGKRVPNGPIELGETGRVLEAGRAFGLEIARRGTRVTVAIDETQLGEFEFHAEASGHMAVCPGDARVFVQEWRISGSIAERKASPDVEALREPIDRAIERGVAFLLSVQQRDGSWASGQPQYVSGQTALSIYALMKSGLAPNEPAVARGLRFLDANPPYDTYSTGLALMAYEATHDPAYKDRMRPMVKNLLATQRGGLWSYPTGWDGKRWESNLGGVDLSNTQYAVLGLRSALAAGVEVPLKPWVDLIDGVVRLQESPATIDVALAAGETGTGKRTIAGFRYNEGTGARGSMTTAGVSALLIAKQALGTKLTGAQAAEVTKSLQLGVGWLGHHFRVDVHPHGEEPWLYYWLYGVERVGSLLDTETLGPHEWYLEGARFLLSKQGGDGAWASNAGGPVRANETDTCYALLFLERATSSKPRTGGAEREFFATKPDDAPDVRLAYVGRGRFEFWIGEFGPRALAEHGGGELGGLRIAAVEYWNGQSRLASLAGDPSRAWTDERYRAKVDLPYPGEYEVVARVLLVGPDAAPDETRPTRTLESKPVKVRSLGLTLSWMDELATKRTKNLLYGKEPTFTPSSINGDDQPWRSIDGLEGSRWMCAKDDPAPTLIVELTKPVQASELVLYSHCATPRLRGEHDVIRRVTVRVNRAKELVEARAGDDELEPLVLSLGKSTSVQRLEIRIVERTPGRAWPGHVGFTEIALYK